MQKAIDTVGGSKMAKVREELGKAKDHLEEARKAVTKADVQVQIARLID